MKSTFTRGLALFLVLLTILACLASCSGSGSSNNTEGSGQNNAALPDALDESVTMTNHTTSAKAKESALYYFNRAYKNGPFAGDPYLFYDEGVFYLYGTTRKYVKPGSIVEKFEVYYSTDLINWEDGGACFSPARGDWCTSRLWAPEVYKIDGKYYMYYTAATGDAGVLHGSVAVADSPLGPFSNKVADGVTGKKPVFDFGNNFPTIDGSVFIDDDGSMYYYFVRDQIGDNSSSGGTNTTTRSTLWGVELENPYTIKQGAKPVKLTEVGKSRLDETGRMTQAWETQQGMWNEGPFLLKHNGVYYLTYSANYFGSKYYAVGYATSDSPLGTYVKPDNLPIMGINPEEDSNWSYFDGTGHAMFLSIEDELYMVYHTLMPEKDGFRHFTIDSVGFRDDGTLYINGPTVTSQNLPAAVTGYANIAPDATLTADGISSGADYLTDGQINASKVYKNLEAVTAGGKTTLTFTFDAPQEVIGVMVYNSADYDTSFTSVSNITIGEHYSFDDAKVLTDSYDKKAKAVYSGSCAILELNKGVRVLTVTVTFDSDKPIQISEIKILAKQAE